MANKKDKTIEPVRMQTGGTVYTPEEYASSYVDFYAPFSIQVQQAPDPDDDDRDDDPIRPNILTPVGERDEGAPNIFSQVPIGDSKAAYNATYKDVNEYLEEFGKDETYKANTGGFEDYLKRGAESIKKQGLLPAGVVSLTGLPTGALAYGMGKLNREQQLKNANAIAQTGGTGGSMMTINGQTVSRRPGSRIFDGTLVGMSNDQAYRLDEIRRGFVPGTMVETASGRPDETGMFNRSGKGGIAGGGKDDDYIIDAYGTVHSAGGAQTVGAFQAERARQDFLRQELNKRGLTFTGDFDAASRAFITSYRDQAKGGRGIFQTTARVDDGTYAKDFANSSKIIDNILNGLSGVTGKAKAEEPKAPPPATEPEVPPSGPPSSGDGDSGDGGYSPPPPSDSPVDRPSYYDGSDDGYQTDPGGGYSDVGGGNQDENEGGGGYDSDDEGDDAPDYDSSGLGSWALGGRIGMQAGGVAQQPQPAGFVGGPPENFTDGQTVADDQPMSVPEGTFVINAAAVEFAGSDDIKKMLSKAYTKLQKKVDKTIGVVKIPTEDEIDVAVSRGEVIVPPEVAKIIGYDRLEKINNRGKKEVTRRQEKAGGGFLDGKKYAKGDKVTVYRGEPLDPANNQGVRTDYGYDQKYVGTHHTPDLRRAKGYANYGNQPGNRVIRSMKVTADEFFDGMQELIVTNNQKARNNKSRMPVSKKLDDDFSRFIESMRNRVLTGQTSLDEITRNMIMNEAVFPDKKSKINFVETYKNDPKSAGKLVAKTISKLGRKAVPVIGAIETAYGMLAPSPLGDATLNPNIRFDDD